MYIIIYIQSAWIMVVHPKSEIFVGVLINCPFHWVSNKKYRKAYGYHLPLREWATTIDVPIAERTITMWGAIQKKCHDQKYKNDIRNKQWD